MRILIPLLITIVLVLPRMPHQAGPALEEITIAQVHAAMKSGQLTSAVRR